MYRQNEKHVEFIIFNDPKGGQKTMRKNIFTKATMRRAAAFGLAGCMAAASLTGCGSSKTESTTAANAETKVEAEG